MSEWPSDVRPAYAGIGSRETPENICELMTRVGHELAARGWVLRTGFAPGADQAFYHGAYAVGPVELFLPWPQFEQARRERDELDTHVLGYATNDARGIAARFHPGWQFLSEGARRLHARNCHQILGPDLESFSRLVLCWTPDGSLDGQGRKSGGTGQALRIADKMNVPVFNLARAADREMIEVRLDKPKALIEFCKGDILDSKAEAIVNPVNTVGVIGRGLALQVKERFPENFEAYRRACEAGEVEPGRMFVFEPGQMFGPRMIINFPTKRHWRDPSQRMDIADGLQDLARQVRTRDVRSLAVPALGCGNGGLDWHEVRPLIELALGSINGLHAMVYDPK